MGDLIPIDLVLSLVPNGGWVITTSTMALSPTSLRFFCCRMAKRNLVITVSLGFEDMMSRFVLMAASVAVIWVRQASGFRDCKRSCTTGCQENRGG